MHHYSGDLQLLMKFCTLVPIGGLWNVMTTNNCSSFLNIVRGMVV